MGPKLLHHYVYDMKNMSNDSISSAHEAAAECTRCFASTHESKTSWHSPQQPIEARKLHAAKQ